MSSMDADALMHGKVDLQDQSLITETIPTIVYKWGKRHRRNSEDLRGFLGAHTNLRSSARKYFQTWWISHRP